MNTFLSRLNAVFAYTLTILVFVTIAVVISSLFHESRTKVKLGVSRAMVRKAADLSAGRQQNDLGLVTLAVDSELQSLFNWNVKQLFVFVTANYKTEKNAVNQVVLWDKIIRRGDLANLNYTDLNAEYYFWDDGFGLRGNQNISLSLSWNIVPNCGSLPVHHSPETFVFGFPVEYISPKAS